MTTAIALIIGAAAGAGIGALVVWAVLRSKSASAESLLLEARLREGIAQEELRKTRDALESEGRRLAEAEGRLDEARKAVTEQKQILDSAEVRLKEAFQSLSIEALRSNSDDFRKTASEALKAQADLGVKDLEGKKALIDGNLDALGKKLEELHKRFEDIGRSNVEKIAEVSSLIRDHRGVTEKLAESAEGLRTALASSKKRGDWGERMAEDVIRLVGLVEGLNYTKQRSLEYSSGRPDYTFFLPNRLRINMDVKFPLDNYLNYISAETEPERARFREELLKNVRKMIKDVAAGREYIDPSQSTVDYAIIFIPNEQVYGFINESAPGIMDDSLRQKIILCSPFTLYAVLAVIRQAVENFSLEQSASEILKHLGNFYKQWNMYLQHFNVMGERLDAARKEYDILDTTRRKMLEKPLSEIEKIRKQKAIPLDETLSLE